MEDFKYSPLSTDTSDPEIRLMELHPADLDDTITCSLRHVRLSSKPSYDALSYCWGTLPPSKTIVCNDNRLIITESLYVALQRLREPDGGHIRHIWVDAICINQSDVPEKNIQVGLMLRIYSEAKCVNAWLGPANDEVYTLMTKLEELGARLRAAGYGELGPRWHLDANSNPIPWWDGSANTSLEPRLAKICDALNELSDEIAERHFYAGVDHLIDISYWSRVWVLQEFVVSKQLQILYGKASLSFDNFALSAMFQGWHYTRQNFAQRIKKADADEFVPQIVVGEAINSIIGAKRRRLGELGMPPDTLFELLIRTCLGHKLTCDQRASNKRDLVYGLLAMAVDRDKLGIDIEYQKSVQEVFTDTARALLHRGYMSILAWNQFPKEIKDLPSWVPDLSVPISDACGEHRHHKIYQAAGPQSYPLLPTSFPPFSSPSQGFSPLSLTCYPIDIISTVGHPWQSDSPLIHAATTAYLDEIENFANRRPPYSTHIVSGPLLRQTHHRWLEAFWRIPTADQMWNVGRARANQTLYTSYAEVRRLMADQAPFEALSRDAFNYCINLSYQISRKPFLSGRGYVGLVPKHALPGDQLAIVEGASVPYVFRERKGGKHGWELIGEAYVDGLMDGEVLEAGTVAPETFQVY